MPKPMTFPTLYDDVLQLSIKKLKELGYIKEERFVSGSLTWSKGNNKIASIGLVSEMQKDRFCIRLSYKYNGVDREYTMNLVFKNSNLHNGKIWYFLCPKTNKRCRIMYLVDGYFLHRDAFQNCMYESQTRSKKYRNLDNVYGAYFKADSLYDKIHKKYFKKTYAGKPTKRYLKLMQQISVAESIDCREIERMMIM